MTQRRTVLAAAGLLALLDAPQLGGVLTGATPPSSPAGRAAWCYELRAPDRGTGPA